jgi:hypothetical protein
MSQTNDVPTGFIKQQPLTILPVTSDATLVDDTIRLVDDGTALVGGPAAIAEGIQGKVHVPVPSIEINISR